VDKKKARLFTVFMGEIEERQKLEDFVPGHHDQGGLSQPNYQRHHEAHVYWHLERVAQRLTELYRERPFDRLILAGPEEVTAELRRLLPRALAQRLVATIPGETFASDAEILQRTLEIEQRAERETEKRLLDELLETAGGGGRATVGLDPTLDALWRDQVQILVVADGLRTSGGECPSCYRLVPAGVATCPVCGTAPRPIDDLVERAVERTLDQNGRVEVVHGEAARRLQEAGGGIGALLRFV
jgi:peptide subunit release factor 1 (eRF1)